MKHFLQSIEHIVITMWHKNNGISIHSVRKERLVYALAYALELVLWACTQFITVDASLFGISNHTMLYATYMVFSLIVMLLWSDKFKPLIYLSVAAMLLGFSGYLFLPDSILRLVFGMLSMAGLGGAVTSARCGFAFAVNNTERVIGMTVMFFSVAGVYFIATTPQGYYIVTIILPIILAVLLTACLLFFKDQDFEVKRDSDKADAKGLYWALVFFIAYFAIDGYIFRMIEVSFTSKFCIMILGMLLAGIIFFVLLLFCKMNAWHMWNVFFLFVLSMALFAVFEVQIGTAVPHYLFAGLSLIGWPLSIYMFACAQRRFASYALLKRSTLIYVLLAPVTTISDDIFNQFFPNDMPIVSLIYILLIIFTFFVLSPYSYKYLFSAEWISDLRKNDMQKQLENVEKVDRFEGYGLTPRQKEVAALLLSGMTRRQISGELGLSESTVKMHTADLYKRLSINSRAELFRIFGVADIAKEDGNIASSK